MTPDFPEEGMHIDDLIDSMMRSGGPKQQIMGLKNLANSMSSHVSEDNKKILNDIIEKVEKAKGTNELRKLYKEFLTITCDGFVNASREHKKKERVKRLSKKKGFRKLFKK